MNNDELQLAWQDADSRRWYPVGRFLVDDGEYRFHYVQGAVTARENAGFEGVPQFRDFQREYRSETLFEFLKNRLIRPGRYDFRLQQQRLDLESITDYDDPSDVFEILARTGGRRATDNFEFYRPLVVDGGTVNCTFFSRGVQYVDESIRSFWADGSTPQEPLRLVADKDNPADPYALLIIDVKIRPLGFVPRYYARKLSQLYHHDAIDEVEVRRHNPAPAPDQERFLIELSATVPDGIDLDDQAVQPLL